MKTAILLLFISLNVFTFAQSGHASPLFEKGMIKGTVVDSVNKAPLQFANITLHRKQDDTFAGGCSTGLNGDFILANVTEGDYFLKVSFVGYENKYVRDIKVSRSEGTYNVGAIDLRKSALEISGAEIVGEKFAEELRLDKKVINVSQNQNAAGGTALDVLQNQPSVRVDPDGTVYLRGSSNFTILVNGKPSVLQGSDALKQIAANSIDNIEIMTNPSAKYDAEGAAGIININLKKQTEYNFSGIANVNAGTKDKYNVDGSLSSNQNGVSLSVGGEYRDNNYTNEQLIDGNSYYADGGANNNTDLRIREHRQQTIFRGSADIPIGDNSTFSLSSSGGKISHNQTLDTKVNAVNALGTIYSQHITDMTLPIKYFNMNTSYDYKVNQGKDAVSLEASYTNVSIPELLNTNEYATDANYSNRQPDPLNTLFSSDAYRNEGRAKANYTHKFSDKSTFEAGLQSNFTYRTFDDLNKIYDWTTDAFTTDNVLTNNFKFRNNVHAGYMTYSDEYQQFNFQAGLRAEYMDRLLEQKTTGDNYAYTKLDFFPSFSISRTIDDHQLQLSYSRRINRPNENFLNPFPYYNDSYLSASGNPRLLPEYINSYEFNYQKTFGSVFTSAQTYYRNSTNAMIQTFDVDKNGKLMTTFGNFATTNTYGVELSSSFPMFSILRLDPGLSIYGSKLNGDLNGVDVSKNTSALNGRLNVSATLTKDTRLQISGNYFGRSADAESEVKPFFMLNASIKQDFLDKTFSLILQANNILKSSYIYVDSKGENFSSKIKVMQEIPVVSLVFTYNFNNFKRSAHQGENVDVQTGF